MSGKMDNFVNDSFLNARAARAVVRGFEVPRYIEFCREAMKMGLAVHLHEAITTVSKYVTLVTKDKARRTFKVRFSNHKPNRGKELEGDCDFFVGHTHTGVRTTSDALVAVKKWMEGKI